MCMCMYMYMYMYLLSLHNVHIRVHKCTCYKLFTCTVHVHNTYQLPLSSISCPLQIIIQSGSVLTLKR